MTAPDTHLERITLTNYRCFDRLQVDFHTQENVLGTHNGRRTTAVFGRRHAPGLARCSRPPSPATVTS
jgi:hypothetical protein